VKHVAGKEVDSRTIRTGIRTAEWVQKVDSDKKGESLYLKVNGRVKNAIFQI
jgi:beta-galactosidase/beta-glucuronidase